MSNTQFYVLLASVIGGVVWQRADYHQLSGRLDRISDDLKQFYRDLGKHEKAIEVLEKK